MTSQSVVRQQLYSYRHYIGIAAAVSLVCQQIYRRVFRVPKELRHIPAVPFWRLMLSMFKEEHLTQRTNRLIYPLLPKANGIYINRIPVDWTIYVANPVLAKAVLFKPEFADKTSMISESLSDSFLAFAGRVNILTVNGEQWKEQRKIMNPAFHRSMPVGIFGSLLPKAFHFIDETESKGNHIILVKLTQRLTLESLGKAVFDFEFGGLDQEDSEWLITFNQVLEAFVEDINFFFPQLNALLRWMSRSRREKYNAVHKFVNLLDTMVEQKRLALVNKKEPDNIPDNEKDLLRLMLEAELRGEGTFTTEELRHNMGFFFLAGHDSISNALALAIYNMAINKNIQTKAREEVIGVVGDKPGDLMPTVDDCKRLPYLDMIIKEVLRIYPAVTDLLARTPANDVNLGGVMIPKGSMISVDVHALHHHPDLWKNPDQFIPERFADGGEYSKHEGVSWLPFGNGTRQCIGVNFTMMELRVALAMFLRKYEWELPAGSPHRNGLVFDQIFNLAPANMEMKFNRRY